MKAAAIQGSIALDAAKQAVKAKATAPDMDWICPLSKAPVGKHCEMCFKRTNCDPYAKQVQKIWTVCPCKGCLTGAGKVGHFCCVHEDCSQWKAWNESVAAKQVQETPAHRQAHLYSGPVYMHPAMPCATCTKSPANPEISCKDRDRCTNYQIWKASRQFPE